MRVGRRDLSINDHRVRRWLAGQSDSAPPRGDRCNAGSRAAAELAVGEFALVEAPVFDHPILLGSEIAEGRRALSASSDVKLARISSARPRGPLVMAA